MVNFARNFIKLAGAGLAILMTTSLLIGCPPEPPNPGDGNGSGGPAAPEVPAGLSITSSDTALEVTITWNSVSGATTYDVYRGAAADSLDKIATIPVSENSETVTHIDDTVENSETYYYAVSAINSAGSSAQTDAVPIAIRVIGLLPIVITADSESAAPGNQPPEAIDERTGGPAATITQLSATLDGEVPDSITYAIDPTSDTNPFSIVGDELILPEDASLDYETAASYELRISGTVGTGPDEVVGELDIIVPVGNTDDEAPIFGAIPTGITVEGDTTTLSVDPLVIVATDSADGALGDEAEIAYALVDGSGDAVAPNGAGLSIFGGFAIDANSGVITVATAPVFSDATPADNTRTIAIRATDTSSGVTGDMTTDATLVITVIAPSTIVLASDAGAVLADGSVEISIDESDDAPVNVAMISVTTTGVTLADTDPYALAAGTPTGFAINDSGLITAQIDYEGLTDAQRNDGIAITIQATGSEAGQNGSLVLTITVDNTDDEAPIFGAIPTGITVEAGTTTISAGMLTITATDGDVAPVGNNGEIAYAFVDGSTTAQTLGNFAIDANSGVITVATAPVFSDATPADNTRTIAIRATDTSSGVTGDMTTDATLVITVIAPSTIVLASDAGAVLADGSVEISIDESDDAPVNVAMISVTTTGVTLADTDPYALAAGTPTGFAINDSGLITAQIDYEALSNEQQTNGITITAQATGSEAGQNGSLVLTITVDNTDDEAPIFGAIPTEITVEGDTTTLSVDPLVIVATDSADGALGDETEIAYALVDDADAAVAPNGAGLSIFDGFAIDANSGVITVATAPVYAGDATDTRTIAIRATDTSSGVTGNMTTDATLVITVIAPSTIVLASDAGAVLADGSVEISIDESDDAPVNVAMISVTTTGVTLADTDPYALAAGTPAGFAITDAGVLTAQLDYDVLTPDQQQPNGITITVQATGSVAEQTGTIVLTITVNNTDDEAPIFGAIPTGITVEGDTTTLSVDPLVIVATDSAMTGLWATKPR